jgi:hypothetical protein
MMRPSVIDELLTYLFDGRSHPLSAPMEMWLTSSRRFIAFVTTFRDKIRKKLRTTQDQDTLLDLQLELETAYFLTRERSLSLVYEPQHCGQGRCPDFAVTFTTSLTFMVEVTRLRASQKRSPATPSSENATASPPWGEAFADAVCSKLGQLLAQSSNMLIIGMDSPSLTQSDLHATMLRIQQRVEGNDSSFWQRYGFRERTDFFRHYYRLSEVIVRGSQWETDNPIVVWINPQAKHPLPGKVRTAVYRSHTFKA